MLTSMRDVPACGRQGCGCGEEGRGEWCAWAGEATGDESVVGSKFVRLWVTMVI